MTDWYPGYYLNKFFEFISSKLGSSQAKQIGHYRRRQKSYRRPVGEFMTEAGKEQALAEHPNWQIRKQGDAYRRVIVPPDKDVVAAHEKSLVDAVKMQTMARTFNRMQAKGTLGVGNDAAEKFVKFAAQAKRLQYSDQDIADFKEYFFRDQTPPAFYGGPEIPTPARPSRIEPRKVGARINKSQMSGLMIRDSTTKAADAINELKSIYKSLPKKARTTMIQMINTHIRNSRTKPKVAEMYAKFLKTIA